MQAIPHTLTHNNAILERSRSDIFSRPSHCGYRGFLILNQVLLLAHADVSSVQFPRLSSLHPRSNKRHYGTFDVTPEARWLEEPLRIIEW